MAVLPLLLEPVCVNFSGDGWTAPWTTRGVAWACMSSAVGFSASISLPRLSRRTATTVCSLPGCSLEAALMGVSFTVSFDWLLQDAELSVWPLTDGLLKICQLSLLEESLYLITRGGGARIGGVDVGVAKASALRNMLIILPWSPSPQRMYRPCQPYPCHCLWMAHVSMYSQEGAVDVCIIRAALCQDCLICTMYVEAHLSAGPVQSASSKHFLSCLSAESP